MNLIVAFQAFQFEQTLCVRIRKNSFCGCFQVATYNLLFLSIFSATVSCDFISAVSSQQTHEPNVCGVFVHLLAACVLFWPSHKSARYSGSMNCNVRSVHVRHLKSTLKAFRFHSIYQTNERGRKKRIVRSYLYGSDAMLRVDFFQSLLISRCFKLQKD